MIELRRVSKAYRVGLESNHVLDDVSATFPTGVSVGILGLNGAGKSTLLRVIGGAEPPDRGSVYKDVRVSWPIAFGGGLHASLTGRENTRFIARVYGESPAKFERFAEEFTELGRYFDMPLRTYSTGMRSRLAFAASMACNFDCYLVDEVTATGDKRFSSRYRQAFKERLKAASIIMVSHNSQTIRQFCTVGAIIHGGKLKMFGTLDQALAAYNQITM
ncbi:MAG: ABC transporter ATP-binding protein [Gammaproteobacteria bacterium]|nr:ABC transporter ATP-binding protein [Gammaproteobacteria bacterium]